MGRPKTLKAKAGEGIHLSFVVDGALIKALDKEAERMTAERRGLTVTRTDLIRMALYDWMDARTEIEVSK